MTEQRNRRKPVFVLVHGAFHGGWCWRRVSDRLAVAGYRCFAPTCTGLGDRVHLLTAQTDHRTFVQDVVALIDAEELDDIVLVGHSFGGVVVTGVAERRCDRIRRLVYLDALIPIDGVAPLDLLPPETAATRRKAAAASGGLTIPTPPVASFDIPAGPDRDWVERHLTPHPLRAYAEPVRLTGEVGQDLPRSFVLCTAPPYPAIAPSFARLHGTPGWSFHELATGHDAMVSDPDGLTALLLQFV